MFDKVLKSLWRDTECYGKKSDTALIVISVLSLRIVLSSIQNLSHEMIKLQQIFKAKRLHFLLV